MRTLIYNLVQMTKSALRSFRGSYWQDARYDYSGSELIYIGMTVQHDSPEYKENWSIWKLTYDVNGEITRKEGPFVSSWDNRTNLNWA